MTDTATRLDSGALTPEAVPSLDDFFEEPGGNIPPGWYDGDLLEGYATQKGVQMVTGDQPDQNGKRRLTFCFGLVVNGKQRNIAKTFFYTPEQFTAENLNHIKELRKQYKGGQSWAGQGQAQNFSINLTLLSQLDRATGFKLQQHPNGGFITAPFVGKKLKVRVKEGNRGYDEVSGFKPR